MPQSSEFPRSETQNRSSSVDLAKEFDFKFPPLAKSELSLDEIQSRRVRDSIAQGAEYSFGCCTDLED